MLNEADDIEGDARHGGYGHECNERCPVWRERNPIAHKEPTSEGEISTEDLIEWTYNAIEDRAYRIDEVAVLLAARLESARGAMIEVLAIAPNSHEPIFDSIRQELSK